VIEFDMKTGTVLTILSQASFTYSAEENVVAPLKDSKGFFVVYRLPSFSIVGIRRYTFK